MSSTGCQQETGRYNRYKFVGLLAVLEATAMFPTSIKSKENVLHFIRICSLLNMGRIEKKYKPPSIDKKTQTDTS